MNTEGKSNMKQKNRAGRKVSAGRLLLFIALAFVFALSFVFARQFKLDEHIDTLRRWLQSLGLLGPAVFTLLYIVGVVTAFPALVMTLVMGALFGPVTGVILVSVASTAGVSLCFLISRHFAKDRVTQWLSKYEKFSNLDRMSEEHGAIIVALTRLVPVLPFWFINYGFGLTRVPFKTYLLWSWLGMFPGTVVYVLSANAVTEGISQGRVPIKLVSVILAAVVVLAALVRAAKKKLHLKEVQTKS